MGNERSLLSAVLQSREAFEKVEAHVTDDDLTEQARIIFHQIREYYERDPSAESVDGDLLSRAVVRSLSSKKHQETFEALIKGLAEAKASPANVVQDFIGVRLDGIGSQIAIQLAGGKGPSEVLSLMDEYIEWAGASELDEEKEPVTVGVDLSSLAEDFAKENLIQVYPRALNDRLDGGLLRGHHMLVYARAEMGKTLFLVNATYGFWRQGLKTLYCGNEEPIRITQLRFAQRVLGKTKYDVLADLERAGAKVQSLVEDRVVWAPLEPGTPRELEALCVEYRPDVLIIDQLRNLNMREDNFVRQLEKAAQQVRQIGKRRKCLVISATQAGDSASGKAVLDQSDVDNSKTGIPGAVDIMVGMGATEEDMARGRRMLSLPKNKASGNHDPFLVGIDTQINKLRSME